MGTVKATGTALVLGRSRGGPEGGGAVPRAPPPTMAVACSYTARWSAASATVTSLAVLAVAAFTASAAPVAAETDSGWVASTLGAAALLGWAAVPPR